MKYSIWDSEGLLLNCQLITSRRFYNTISNSAVEFQEFVIKGRNILRSVLFPVCLKVSLNVAYCWNVFNVTQRMVSYRMTTLLVDPVCSLLVLM